MKLGRLGPAVAILAGALVTGSRVDAKQIQSVSVDPAFFNPFAGQAVLVALVVTSPGSVALTILDRDGYVIRTIDSQAVSAGVVKIRWDGKDSAGAIVPDEAYSVRVETKSAAGSEIYEPAKGFVPITENVASGAYSSVDAVLTYRLARASRVHIQAGQVVGESADGTPTGPVLRTIVDRQPRVAGAVVERWSGFDESGTIYIPDLRGFGVSVAAMSLPENSLITTGNRKLSFVEYARKHRPADDQKPRVLASSGHQHHQGLTVFEDHSPDLTVAIGGDSKNPTKVKVGSAVRLRINLAAESAAYFFAQPATLLVFVDERTVSTFKTNDNPSDVTIEAKDLAEGVHRIAVNWASAFGPVAVWAKQIEVTSTELGRRGKP
jgi:hypothetical protein